MICSVLQQQVYSQKIQNVDECDVVSLRNGNAWTSVSSKMQSNSGVDIFALVAAKGRHFDNVLIYSIFFSCVATLKVSFLSNMI